MRTVSILETKTHLFRLVEQVETGVEAEIVIARNGRPVVRLVPMAVQPTQGRIGVAKGQFVVPEDIDGSNDDVASLFGGESAT
jgi:prevent-host-death family protein